MTTDPTQSFTERATSRDHLEKRLRDNAAYGSADFVGWLMERLAVQPGEDVLDVGCGSGAQSIPMAERAGSRGSVSGVDISAQSVATLRDRVPTGANVQAEVGDMDSLAGLIDGTFRVKRYDLAQSSYALYYANQPTAVLDVMRGALKPGGRIAVFVPNTPHGLVDLAARFTTVDPKIVDSLHFGPRVLAPWFEARMTDIAVHDFTNIMRVPDADKVIEFFRATTYYDAVAEEPMRAHVQAEIDRDGAFVYEKHGYLIIGRLPA